MCNSYTIRRGEAPVREFYQSFSGVMNEYYPSFIKSAVCWQSALFLPQLLDAQAPKVEAEVGIGRLMPVFRVNNM